MIPFLVVLEQGLSVGFHKDKSISWKVAYLHDELNYLWISAGIMTCQMYTAAKSSFLGPMLCFSTNPNLTGPSRSAGYFISGTLTDCRILWLLSCSCSKFSAHGFGAVEFLQGCGNSHRWAWQRFPISSALSLFCDSSQVCASLFCRRKFIYILGYMREKWHLLGISPICKAGQFLKLFSCDRSLSLLAAVLVIPPPSWVILVSVWVSLDKPIQGAYMWNSKQWLSYTCRKISPLIFSFDSPDKHALILPQRRAVLSNPRAYLQHQTRSPPSRKSHPSHHRAQENNCRPTYPMS